MVIGHGGVIIKRNVCCIILIFITILSSMNMIYAGPLIHNTTSMHTSENTKYNNSENNIGNPENPTNTDIYSSYAAAGTSTVTSGSFSSIQICAGSTLLKNYIEVNKKLPNTVSVGDQQVTVPQFLQLMVTSLIKINKGDTTLTAIKNVTAPTNSYEQLKNGTLSKSSYLSIASSVKSFIDTNKRVPNYASSTLGKIGYESLVYMYSRILSFYDINKRLPSYVTLNTWMGSSTNNTTNNNSGVIVTPPGMEAYVKPTKNCQSTDPTIKSQAQTIIAGANSTYEAAVKIFNWVQSNISYSFYYNSAKGALGTLSSKSANCCDTAHLLVALARAVGIPAQYKHGTCTFSDGTFGHVWAQLYVDGTWYNADASTKYNSFGNVSWTLNTLKGTYIELPF